MTMFEPNDFEDRGTFATQEQKAKYANAFVRFVQRGYRRTMFPKWFYVQTSFLWGNIAEFSQDTFYANNFASAAGRVRFFVRMSQNARDFGPWGDVEVALAKYVALMGYAAEACDQHAAVVEAQERAELARLTAKYGKD